MTHAEAAAGGVAPSPVTRPTVGVVGLGHMGSAMATRLAHEGHPLWLYNRSAERTRALASELGARVAAAPAEIAAGVDVLITMVSDDAAVTSLYRADGGILEGLTSRTVAVDMSTVLPDTIRALELDVRATGAGVLDAPVSGSVTLAESGQLTLMVGGEADDLERARPALAALGSRIFHLGSLGSGATMKLAVNAIVFGLGGALAEALVLAEKAGVDPSTAYDVFAASAIASPFVGYKRAAFLATDRAPVAFSIDLALKDLRLILELADRVGAAMPAAQTSSAVLRAAADDVGGGLDFSAVASHLRGRHGASQPGERDRSVNAHPGGRA